MLLNDNQQADLLKLFILTTKYRHAPPLSYIIIHCSVNVVWDLCRYK